MGMANPFLGTRIKYLQMWHANNEELKRFAMKLEPEDLVDYNAYALLFTELKRLIEKYNTKIKIEYIKPGTLPYERTRTSYSFLVTDKEQPQYFVDEPLVKDNELFFDEKELVID
jgi:hypothetical protein